MKPLTIGIAGGSGTGKSTLVAGLQQALPDQTVLVQWDDYFKPPEELEHVFGMPNYDTLDAIYLGQMLGDIRALKAGESIRVHAKDHTEPGELGTHSTRQWVAREPKPILLVEGFYLLGSPEIRDELDLKIFLDAPFDLHYGRRIHFKDDVYTEKVLRPFQENFVTQSKQYADHVIDVSKSTPAQVLQEVLATIPANCSSE